MFSIEGFLNIANVKVFLLKIFFVCSKSQKITIMQCLPCQSVFHTIVPLAFLHVGSKSIFVPLYAFFMARIMCVFTI